MSATYVEQLEQEVTRLRLSLTEWVESMQFYTDAQYGKGRIKSLIASPSPVMALPTLADGATPEQMLAFNKQLIAYYSSRGVPREDYQDKFKAPCQSCPFDGVYRCEACTENGYAGFNRRNYLEEVALGMDGDDD